MLCTKRRPRLLPLVIYMGGKLLEPNHIATVWQWGVGVLVSAESGADNDGSLGPSLRRRPLPLGFAVIACAGAHVASLSSFAFNTKRKKNLSCILHQQSAQNPSSYCDQAKCPGSSAQLERKTTRGETALAARVGNSCQPPTPQLSIPPLS